MGAATRREAAAAAARGEITVNGTAVRRADVHIDPAADTVVFRGETVIYAEYTYIMLDKPEGYISSTEERGSRTVMSLLPDKYVRRGLFPCGRLDIDTVGLLILTNDGPLAHFMLSPRHHVEKEYSFRLDREPTATGLEMIGKGIDIGDEKPCLPAEVCMTGALCGTVTITEGRYHQVKRMFEAAGSKVVFLERTRFAGLPLDRSIGRGGFRELTCAESSLLQSFSPNS